MDDDGEDYWPFVVMGAVCVMLAAAITWVLLAAG